MDTKKMDAYIDMKVRDLSLQEKAIGRIIIHSLFILIVCYAKDKEVIQFTGHQDTNSDYMRNVRSTVNYLDNSIEIDWATLRKLWQVNDYKVLQVLQQILIDILKEPETFALGRLRKAEGRIAFENDFSKLCKSVLQDLEGFFEESCDPQYPLE